MRYAIYKRGLFRRNTQLENKAEPTGDGGMFSMPPRSRGTGRVPKGNLQGATNGVESLW